MADAVDREQLPAPSLAPHGPGVEHHAAALAAAGELLDRGLERRGDLGGGLRVPERDGERRRDHRVPAVGEEGQEQAVPQGGRGPGEGPPDEVDDALGGPGAGRGQEDGAAGGLFFFFRWMVLRFFWRGGECSTTSGGHQIEIANGLASFFPFLLCSSAFNLIQLPHLCSQGGRDEEASPAARERHRRTSCKRRGRERRRRLP